MPKKTPRLPARIQPRSIPTRPTHPSRTGGAEALFRSHLQERMAQIGGVVGVDIELTLSQRDAYRDEILRLTRRGSANAARRAAGDSAPFARRDPRAPQDRTLCPRPVTRGYVGRLKHAAPTARRILVSTVERRPSQLTAFHDVLFWPRRHDTVKEVVLRAHRTIARWRGPTEEG